MLAVIEDCALPTYFNIEADEYKDLFGHQHQFLENRSGRTISSSNNLWFDTPAAEAATSAAASAAVAVIGIISSRNDPSPIATATATAAATAATDSGHVENPGLNTGGDADATDGASHVQKLRHWKQKIREMQGTSVEIKSRNQMVKWTIIEDVDPQMMHGPAKSQILVFRILILKTCRAMNFLCLCSSTSCGLGLMIMSFICASAINHDITKVMGQ
jgi:hypothetical protein